MKPRTTDFDAIAASVPLNETAGRVTAGSREAYEPKVQFASHQHWETPPPMRPIPSYGPAQATARELIGTKFGRFTVVGLLAEFNRKKNIPWVVRCVCGDYEVRKARAIRNPLNKDDCCMKCRHLKLIKKRYEHLGPRDLGEFIKPAGDGKGGAA